MSSAALSPKAARSPSREGLMYDSVPALWNRPPGDDMQIEGKIGDLSRRIIESGSVMCGQNDVLSFKLKDGEENLTLLVEFADAVGRSGSLSGSLYRRVEEPSIRFAQVDQQTAKATFVGANATEAAIGPVKLGTLNNNLLTGYFDFAKISGVVRLSFTFWIDG